MIFHTGFSPFPPGAAGLVSCPSEADTSDLLYSVPGLLFIGTTKEAHIYIIQLRFILLNPLLQVYQDLPIDWVFGLTPREVLTLKGFHNTVLSPLSSPPSILSPHPSSSVSPSLYTDSLFMIFLGQGLRLRLIFMVQVWVWATGGVFVVSWLPHYSILASYGRGMSSHPIPPPYPHRGFPP